MRYIKKTMSRCKVTAEYNKEGILGYRMGEEDLYGGGLGDLLEAYFELKNKKNPDIFEQQELKILIDGLNQVMQLNFTK